jgi:hypothetical protein
MLLQVYLEDVLDHVVRGLEEIGGCIEMCDSTKEVSDATPPLDCRCLLMCRVADRPTHSSPPLPLPY